MIARAKQLSSLNAVGANAIAVRRRLLGAARASWGREPHLEAAFKTLATRLLNDDRAGAINGLAHYLRLDAIELHSHPRGHRPRRRQDPGRPPPRARPAAGDPAGADHAHLHPRGAAAALHADQRGLARRRSSARRWRSRSPRSSRVMRQAFPRAHRRPHTTRAAFDEQATYLPQGIDDYGRIETEILEPHGAGLRARARDRHRHLAPLGRVRLSGSLQSPASIAASRAGDSSLKHPDGRTAAGGARCAATFVHDDKAAA